ncbi:MAG: TM2 domain-containing protein, partial [Flavobacteriales bacterium]|nr:TM2 domain-containing protein [Flavobacteriales bacterium]
LRELAQWTPSDTLTEKENSRLVSALLAVTLGPFGAHRLYLGTVPKVPIIYGVTFGGFGVLVLIDLGHLL